MPGLLDLVDDPQQLGLLSLGLRLMSTPGKFGAALGQAGMGALGDVQQARQAMEARKLREQQMALQQAAEQRAQQQFVLQQQLGGLQVSEAARAAAEREARAALAKDSVLTPSMVAMAQNGGPTQAAAAALPTTPQGFDFKRYSEGLAALGDVNGALAIQQALKKEQPKFSTEPRYDQAGRAYIVAEDGRMKYLDGVSARDELVSDDNGGTRTLRTKFSSTPVAVVNKTVDPNTAATNAVTMRGQNMTAGTAAQRLAFDRENAGGFEYKDDGAGNFFALPKKPTGPGAIQPVPVNMPNKNVKASTDALSIVDEARSLIPQATGSYVGLGADMVAQAVGSATDGAKAAAKLKVLQANLMLKQPRMEGPQSDKDVMLYREAAGQIGDPTVPADIKLAALDTIQTLHEKYVGKPVTPPWLKQPQSGQPGLRFLGFEPSVRP